MKQTEERDEAVLASLKKLGPSRPREIADDAGIDPVALKDTRNRLLKRGLIITAGKTMNRRWALPEQKIALADLVGAAEPPKKAEKVKATKRKSAKRKAKAVRAAKPKRKYTRRKSLGHVVIQRADAASIRARAALDAQFAARLAAAPAPLDKLRIALDEYLAVLTDMRQKLVGAMPDPQPTVLVKVA